MNNNKTLNKQVTLWPTKERAAGWKVKESTVGDLVFQQHK